MDEKKIEEELNKIWDETPVSHSDSAKQSSWEEFQSKAFSSKKKKIKPWRYYAAAAVLVFALAGTGIYLTTDTLGEGVFVTENVIENATLKVKKIVLPDSSRVELSPNSKIIFAANFAVNRKIEMEGEAYFQVKKDKKHPFQVSCNETTTTVLGTSFTVKGNIQKEVFVELYEGSVRMNLKNVTKEWILKPGEKFSYENKKPSVAEFNRFVDFENEKITAVGTYIELNYGYKMTVPAEYSNQRITIRINKKENLKTIVQLISEMYNLNFEVNDDLKQITFQ